ncbi:hypothetical protein [Mediterraneibacter gnavus]|uniref:hypothetical protein n=1 Tax=Mediterraneibacter gnavus TaxID=33038 RepID=UPI003567A0C2
MKEHDCSYSTRIGKTTFIVNVKQSETAQKPLNTVIRQIKHCLFRHIKIGLL